MVAVGAVEPSGSLALEIHKTSLSEHLEVLRHARERKVDVAGDVSG
jgi:hypothetical protein